MPQNGESRATRRRERSVPRKIAHGIGASILAVTGTTIVAGVGEAAYMYTSDNVQSFLLPVPDQPPLENLPEGLTVVCDIDHPECTTEDAIAYKATSRHDPIKLEDMPEYFVKAQFALEDSRFYQHDGVSGKAVGRSIWRDANHVFSSLDTIGHNLLNSRGPLEGIPIEGASTATMQLADSGFMSVSDRQLNQKYNEMGIAKWLEKSYTKDEIAEMFFAHSYYGRGAWGPEAAAQQFYGKSLNDLTEIQGRILVGKLNNPDAYALTYDFNDPANLDRTIKAMTAIRNRTLEGIAADYRVKNIDLVKKQQLEKDLGQYFGSPDPQTGKSTWIVPFIKFTDPTVINTVPSDAMGAHQLAMSAIASADYYRQQDPSLQGRGMRVVTTIGIKDQTAMWQAINGSDLLHKAYDKEGADIGAISLRKDGSVAAEVGSLNQAQEFSMARGTHGGGSGNDPGSTNKLYAAVTLAEKNGADENTTIKVRKSVRIKLNDGRYYTIDTNNNCANIGQQPTCEMSLGKAFAESSNTAFGEVVNELGGIEPVSATMKALGLPVPDPHNASIVLGVTPFGPWDGAKGYASIGLNQGQTTDVYSKISIISDGDKPVFTYQAPKPKQVVTKKAAKVGVELMRAVVTDGTAAGTQTPPNGPLSVGGKTGTGNTLTGGDGKKVKASTFWYDGIACDAVLGSRAYSFMVANPKANDPIETIHYSSQIARIANSYIVGSLTTGTSCDVTKTATMPK